MRSQPDQAREDRCREIFLEEGLRSLQDFQHRPIIENDKRPDFLFPCDADYENSAFPTSQLRMLRPRPRAKIDGGRLLTRPIALERSTS